jgi:serine/threonine-protein kinase TTK/MPS1
MQQAEVDFEQEEQRASLGGGNESSIDAHSTPRNSGVGLASASARRISSTDDGTLATPNEHNRHLSKTPATATGQKKVRFAANTVDIAADDIAATDTATAGAAAAAAAAAAPQSTPAPASAALARTPLAPAAVAPTIVFTAVAAPAVAAAPTTPGYSQGNQPAATTTTTQHHAAPGAIAHDDNQVAASTAAAEPSTPQESKHSAKQKLLLELGNRIHEVNGRPYVVIDRLGKGGTSVVHRVMDSKRRIWALKTVDLSNADAKTIEGMVNEIHVLRHLNEANVSLVVRLVDYELRQSGTGKDSKKSLDVVLELGETDFSVIMARFKGPLPGNYTRLYWQQMLEAVHAIHEQNVVHSDLKPANFVLVKGRLKLIDFGIANTIAADTTNIVRDTQIGTINFISPEALNAVDETINGTHARYKLGRASDVWSLGVILHKMLFDEHLFPMTNIAHKLKAICSQVEFDFSSKPCELPHAADVLHGCLRRQPKQRMTIPELLAHDFLHP